VFTSLFELRANPPVVRARIVEDLYFNLAGDTFYLAQDFVLGSEGCPLVLLGRHRNEVTQR
jgi:hypothetical protein